MKEDDLKYIVAVCNNLRSIGQRVLEMNVSKDWRYYIENEAVPGAKAIGRIARKELGWTPEPGECSTEEEILRDRLKRIDKAAVEGMEDDNAYRRFQHLQEIHRLAEGAEGDGID